MRAYIISFKLNYGKEGSEQTKNKNWEDKSLKGNLKETHFLKVSMFYMMKRKSLVGQGRREMRSEIISFFTNSKKTTNNKQKMV